MIARIEASQMPSAAQDLKPVGPALQTRRARFIQPRAVKARLTAAAENELVLKMINDHCQVSRERLIAANLPLVAAIAWLYSGRGIEMVQLVHEGRAGLCAALDTFDPTHGGRFSTYASWGIKQALKQAVKQGARTGGVPRLERA